MPLTTYLKLGGSLITDKTQPETPRPEVLARLAAEVATARAARPDLRLVLGHGSGSFGHVHAKQHGTRDGVQGSAGWLGFARVGDAAARLNRLVIAALLEANVPAWSIQPGAALRCRDGEIVAGPETTVAAALDCGLVPVVHGDVALDSRRGGTIASTEEIFAWLMQCKTLQPARLLLAGEVDGIFSSDPHLDPDARCIERITPNTLATIEGALGGSRGVDVTGGMVAKVRESIALVQAHPDLIITLFSGLIADQVSALLTHGSADPDRALHIGTQIERG